MSKIIKLPIKVNKSNGQLSTYIQQRQLPKDVLDSIKEQPLATRKLLFEFRGLDDD